MFTSKPPIHSKQIKINRMNKLIRFTNKKKEKCLSLLNIEINSTE